MTKEEHLFESRLSDLAQTAWNRGIPCFTDFLSLNEQNIYHASRTGLSYVKSVLYGGYDLAERQMLGFLPDALSFEEEEEDRSFQTNASSDGRKTNHQLDALFPIRCLAIRPLNAKFSDALTHRDYLGSLMNLGTERSQLGDIIVEEDRALVMVHERMADYIMHELTRVRHTSVYCELFSCSDIQFVPKVDRITGTVSSVRLDAILSLAFKSSRSSLSGLIEGGKCFVNGRLITSNSAKLKEGDLVSVRGLGKFRYAGEGNLSRKGRIYVEVERFI